MHSTYVNIYSILFPFYSTFHIGRRKKSSKIRNPDTFAIKIETPRTKFKSFTKFKCFTKYKCFHKIQILHNKHKFCTRNTNINAFNKFQMLCYEIQTLHNKSTSLPINENAEQLK